VREHALVEILIPEIGRVIARRSQDLPSFGRGFSVGSPLEPAFLTIQSFVLSSVKLLEQFDDCSRRALTEFDLQ
jgi:hypothetical protein